MVKRKVQTEEASQKYKIKNLIDLRFLLAIEFLTMVPTAVRSAASEHAAPAAPRAPFRPYNPVRDWDVILNLIPFFSFFTHLSCHCSPHAATEIIWRSKTLQ